LGTGKNQWEPRIANRDGLRQILIGQIVRTAIGKWPAVIEACSYQHSPQIQKKTKARTGECLEWAASDLKRLFQNKYMYGFQF
jgi:hypothetical protein